MTVRGRAEPSSPGPGAAAPARSLVIPMYNEAGRIGATLAALALAPDVTDDLEIVLVDDGSSDGTPEVAAKAAARAGLVVEVVRLAVNQGKGAAVRAGMLHARGLVRVYIDADLSVGVDDIERCFAAVEAGAGEVVYGTRAHHASAIPETQPWHRVVSGRTFNLLVRLLGLAHDRDTQCGLKGFTAAAADELFGGLQTRGFAFDVEVLARAERAGFSLASTPVTWRHADGSRVRMGRDALDMTRSAIAIRRRLRAGTPRVPAPGDRAMDAAAYEAMHRVEDAHWWFTAKHQLVLDELAGLAPTARVLDVGAGTGGFAAALGRAGRVPIAAEFDREALGYATGRAPATAFVRSTAEALPFDTGRVDAVTALDVIEHLDDDVAALRELRRVVRPGGLIVVTVPAYQWMWSDHDERLGHRRRYTRASLARAARLAGLEIERCTHFHSWLTPPAVLVRHTPLGRLMGGSPEEASDLGPRLNRLLLGLSRAEARVLTVVSSPLGLSVLLVARAPSEPLSR